MFEEDKKQKLIDIVIANPDNYRMSFIKWMPKNWHIIYRFFIEANRVWASGRRHHSARDLCAFLRHETALEEARSPSRINPNGFKISNNSTPYLARLYLDIYPERNSIFSLKELKASKEL
jgi:hypothetical protein